MLTLTDLNQLAAQHSQTGFLVLELATLGLAGNHDAGCLVDQTNSGRCLVDVLTARTGGTEDLHFVIFSLDLEILGIVFDFGNDFNC